MGYSANKIYLSCDEDVVEAWVSFMLAHHEEVSLSLLQEGVRHEMWFMGKDDEGLFLIGVMDTDDLAASRAVAINSSLKVDEVHREFKKHWNRNISLPIDATSAPEFPGCKLLMDIKA